MMIRSVLGHNCLLHHGCAIITWNTTRSLSSASSLVLVQRKNNVTTLTMNNPKKLNAWTFEMMETLKKNFDAAAKDPDTKAVVLTGADPYYCAGVSLNSLIRPMGINKLYKLLVNNNKMWFEVFIEFPKPFICAVNGPAIGASVTSASISDYLIASERATFATPFAALGITPEGCSSVHFEKLMGKENANRMLGKEGWKPTGQEAFNIGLASEVVKHEDLMLRAQELGEQFAKSGKKRWLIEENKVAEYKAINDRESFELADSFLAAPFLQGQYQFLRKKGKNSTAAIFWTLKATRPIWSMFLKK